MKYVIIIILLQNIIYVNIDYYFFILNNVIFYHSNQTKQSQNLEFSLIRFLGLRVESEAAAKKKVTSLPSAITP